MTYPSQHSQVRGTILEKQNNSLVIEFEGSNAFWDQSNIGIIGKELRLESVQDTDRFEVGEKVIAEGKPAEYRTFLIATKVIPNTFQPFGIDWKTTALFSIFLIIFLIGLFIYKVVQEMKQQLASSK